MAAIWSLLAYANTLQRNDNEEIRALSTTLQSTYTASVNSENGKLGSMIHWVEQPGGRAVSMPERSAVCDPRANLPTVSGIVH